MATRPRITRPDLDWGETGEGAGAPRSVFFDDIYFSGDGLAETNHVFLAGNDLPARFKSAQRFSIGELGFGTGLNFLAAWACWRKSDKPAGARFHFFSVEAYPLGRQALARAHAAWPDLAGLSARLIAVWPPPHAGFHQIDFNDGATLTVYFGDALNGLAQAEGAMDSWFLDGFSPAKNPDMWRTALMAEMARLSRPGATAATFTVAGDVRRALTAAGFTVEKRPGFGRKREMLTARLRAPPRAPSMRRPWFAKNRNAPLAPGASVAVIGGGIAGASLARALLHAGLSPVVFERTAPASGASGNPAGLIMPRLDAADTPAGRFHASAYLYTVQLLQRLQETTHAALFNPCGVVLHATSERERKRQSTLLAQHALPEGWIAPEKDGLFFPQGGVVHPPSFVRTLLGATPVRTESVMRIRRADAGWRIETGSNAGAAIFDAVVIANGLDALRFGQARSLPLAGAAGQVDWFPDISAPETARAFGPYAAPVRDGGLIIGATYAPIAISAAPSFTAEATDTTIKAVARTLPSLAARLDAKASRPRASVRCVTPDRLPVAGPAPDWGFYGGAYDGLRTGRRTDYPDGVMLEGMFILTGLGSRGLVTAPLAAAMITAEMTGAPAPVDFAVAEALHPARFFVRDLKRGKRAAK